MDKKTLEALDYYRIRNQIAQLCTSEEGRAALLCREPFSKVEEFSPLKKLSREWCVCLSSQKNIFLKSWLPVENLFSITKTKGAFLPLEQIFAIGTFCISTREIKENIAELQKDPSTSLGVTDTSLRLGATGTINVMSSEVETSSKKTSALATLVETIPNLSEAENEIFKIIDKDGALKDLKELREIKNAIAQIHREIENAFKRITADSNFSQYLESNLPVVRAEREVLAVKSSERTKVKGIIHEVSNTGRTVFIEPDEVVKLNNDLLQKEFEYEQAVRQILIALTEKLGAYSEDFFAALKIMILLDVSCAAAKWGMQTNGSYAHDITNENQNVFLQQARHPLLTQTLGLEKTIPIDINFLSAKKVLIITGPNTGGKTVAIKTFALFALLNQAGFPIPAGAETRLPCFDAIFADIGDEQSLDDSLSTFSAHIKNIATAVQNATEKSLVLLDELGSGTDPQEGAAIAMAVLDELLERGSFVLVTTHQGALKNYGWTNPLCENASVEFDSATMRPSYKIAMGIPGESHALEIAADWAQKLPTFKGVVQKAQGYIQSQRADVSTLIKGLNQKHFELDTLIAEQKEKQETLEERALKNQETQMRLRRREHDLKVAESKEESNFLRESRKRLENLVRELREGEITREKTLAVRGFINELEEAEQKHLEHLEAEEENLLRDEEKFEEKLNSHKSNKPTKPRKKNAAALLTATPTLPNRAEQAKKIQAQFVEGAKVFLKSGGSEGVLLRKEKDDIWSVQFGAVKMEVEQKKLRLANAVQNENAARNTPSIIYDLVQKNDNSVQYDIFPENKPLFELRLMGYRADEALKILEKQIDLCIIHGLNSFSVIHGKGTGALQQAVQDYLSHCTAVAEFAYANANDGGFGKTYVRLG